METSIRFEKRKRRRNLSVLQGNHLDMITFLVAFEPGQWSFFFYSLDLLVKLYSYNGPYFSAKFLDFCCVLDEATKGCSPNLSCSCFRHQVARSPGLHCFLQIMRPHFYFTQEVFLIHGGERTEMPGLW